MLIAHKNVGETPLELLERIRREQPELLASDVKLSYAGRLDPMAEGQMLVLVGEQENSPENRAKFLGLEKEYEATFLVGMKTDTSDCLGLISKSAGTVSREIIEQEVGSLKNITEQTYPWFSGKTVDGVKLFDHFKAGNTQISRPTQKIQIIDVTLLKIDLDIGEQDVEEIKTYIFESIKKVHEKIPGDFRKAEIVKRWEEFFTVPFVPQIFTIKIRVSSGTFIRALNEHFSFPATLLKLNRTRIVMPSDSARMEE